MYLSIARADSEAIDPTANVGNAIITAGRRREHAGRQTCSIRITISCVLLHIYICRWPYIAKMEHKKTGNSLPENGELDSEAYAHLKKNGPTVVAELWGTLRFGHPSLTEEELTNLVWRLVRGDKVDVTDLQQGRSLWEYLRFWDRNLCFYFSLAITVMTVMAVYFIPSNSQIVMLRWGFGLIFLIFVPGYFTVEALFPKPGAVDAIERIALSIGLSLVLVPFTCLILNYAPWGIGLTPILVSLITITLVLATVALARRYRTRATL